MLSVDLSNYTTNVPVPGSGAAGGFITDQNCQDLISGGFTHAIIGTQWLGVTKHQLEICQRNGMTLDIYSWLSWNRDIPTYIRDRLRFADEFPIGIHWLDAEEAIGSFSPQQIVGKIQQGVDAVTNSESGIYTAEWWWPSNTANSRQFRDKKLWHAGYTYPRVPSLDSFRSYGGWVRPHIWQYAGSVSLYGLNLDLNVMDDVVVPQPPQPVEEEFYMNPVWAIAKDPNDLWPHRTYLLFATPSGLKKDWIETAAQEQAFRKAGIITRTTPLQMDVVDIKQFVGKPEPDDPATFALSVADTVVEENTRRIMEEKQARHDRDGEGI